MKKVILLAGPTASGKSELAIYIAKKINGEIINADSMQVFKEIKILSARPEDDKNIKHHLYGFVSVKKNFSTGEWIKYTEKKINEILKKKKTPVIVGGTGLYFKSLINGIAQIPNISKAKRDKIIKLFNQIGVDEFYKKLIKLDPKCKNKIIKNDKQRMIRFYEVKFYTKKSIFDWQKNTKNNFKDINFKKIFLNFPREVLLVKIEKRFKKMVDQGAIIEAKKFKKLGVSKILTSNNILGLKEIMSYLEGKMTLKEAVERSIIRTRQYIKRQMTWFRGQMKDWNEFNDLKQAELRKKVLKFIRTP
ncbi:MAG: tRNA (adenosine(37)-N6)-dimethylallyltransferase MiaA [Pelagibacteraceae bacterium]|nr:tRNA (adenosine(37)-N6)-dimethylallyltransferase MiaA [Pelagibacteraceae bacterium]OUV88234.1 MAG: tRNA (adenosine(37)-N6)-dimethylallyltransferase MiaA [Pelagibacteraceae bacterium TMED146]